MVMKRFEGSGRGLKVFEDGLGVRKRAEGVGGGLRVFEEG